jgi:hypothetical protein
MFDKMIKSSTAIFIEGYFMSEEQISKPPQSTEFKRELDFYPFQVIGIPLIFIIPMLALFGVLGETTTILHATGNSIEVSVSYSNRINLQSFDEMEISIRNTSNEAISSLTVSIEKAFLDNFSEISFLVDISEISDEAYVIELLDLEPKEAKIIRFSSRGTVFGSHQGIITVSTGEDAVRILIETFIFP